MKINEKFMQINVEYQIFTLIIRQCNVNFSLIIFPINRQKLIINYQKNFIEEILFFHSKIFSLLEERKERKEFSIFIEEIIKEEKKFAIRVKGMWK